MIYLIICLLLILAAVFALRFYMLKAALQDTSRQLQEICQNIGENQVVHLPLPDRDLEMLMASMNQALNEIRVQGENYARRERAFQAQIQAISHDLRTPLTVILGYLKFFQKKDAMSADEQKEILKIMERKARSMEDLVAEFYDYSRLYARDYTVTIEKTDAGKILREVFAENCLMLESAHLQVSQDLPQHPVWVLGQAGALERIFANLFQNAARYGDSFLELTMEEKGSQILISFTNNTTSLSPGNVPYLFDRFYMGDPSRSRGGSGLGLTIAHSLARAMGGSLTAEMPDGDAPSSPDAPDKDEKDAAFPGRRIRFTLCLKSAGSC